MNKIFKKIWSRSRGCFVAVSEVASSVSLGKDKTTALVVGCVLCANALSEDLYILEGGDVNTGDLIGYDQIHITKNVSNVQTGSILAPTGYVGIYSVNETRFSEPFGKEVQLYKEGAKKVLINGNAEASKLFLSAPTFRVTGDITVHGKVSNEKVDAYINSAADSFWNLFNDSSEGVAFLGANYESDGFTIEGDLNSSLVYFTTACYPNSPSIKHFGQVKVKGNLISDNVLVDGPSNNFDQYTDSLFVDGLTTVSNNVVNQGFIQLNKAVIGDTLFNAIGEFRSPGLVTDYDNIGAVINDLDVPNIQSGSNLIVGKFSRASNILLTISGGTVKSTENWLNNSTIKLSGGYLDSDLFGTDKSLGVNNVYTITGGTLATTNLGTGSKITVSDSGIFKTTTDIAFKDYDPVQIGLNIIGLNSSSETTKEILTDRFVEFNPGTLADQFANDVSFTNGTLQIYDARLTKTQAASLKKAFKSKICLLIPPANQN